MAKSDMTPSATGNAIRRLVVGLLIVSGALTLGYTAICATLGALLPNETHIQPVGTPAIYGLKYKDVTFPAREDQVQLRGWFIPGVLPDGTLTAQRAIIFVHGRQANRTDPSIKLLELSVAFARHGFAVLAFDLRGNGQSPPAPLDFGYFGQRDVLGAVDYLRSGPLPYPALGRPRAIAGWGVSTGAATLLLAAAHEPGIQAIVSDTAFAEIVPIMERELPKQVPLPSMVTPGALLAVHLFYGVDYYAVRPVDVVARLAPRPLFFIHGDHDDFIPASNMDRLVNAARTAPNAHVTSWLTPGVTQHASSYKTLGDAYVNRVVAFYTDALGPDTSAAP